MTYEALKVAAEDLSCAIHCSSGMSTIPDSNSNSAMAPRGSLRAACFAAVTVFMKFLSLAQREEICAGPFARRCKFRANNAEGANRAMRNQESNTSKSHSWTRHGRPSMHEKLRSPGYMYLLLISVKLTGWFITIRSRPSVACLSWTLPTIGERPSRVGAAVPNEPLCSSLPLICCGNDKVWSELSVHTRST